MMKLLISLLSLLATSSNGFVVSPAPATSRAATSSSLKVATQPPTNNNSWDDWSTKPIPPRRSTTPVAKQNVSKLERAKMKDRILDPDYTLSIAVFLLGPLIAWYHPSYTLDGTPSLVGIFGAGFHIVFAALLWVQTARVRCVFEKDSFEFYNVKGKGCDLNKGAKLVKKPSNYVAGTENKWTYDSITNYGFFPSLDFPVICYFKETETPEFKWNRWFAAFDSYQRGQPHFFPGICNAVQFKEEMEKRGVKSKPIPSLKDISR